MQEKNHLPTPGLCPKQRKWFFRYDEERKEAFGHDTCLHCLEDSFLHLYHLAYSMHEAFKKYLLCSRQVLLGTVDKGPQQAPALHTEESE